MAVSIGSLIARLGLDTTGLDAGLARARRSIRDTGKAMKQMGANMTRFVTLPLLAAAAGSVKMAVDFETSMVKIETLVGLSTAQVQKMSVEVMKLSGETGRSSKELADALFVVTSAGQRGAEAMQILERAAKASAIGLGETKDIARTVTAVMNAYGKENMSAAKATEILMATVREGNLEASSLAPVLGRVIGMAATLKISFAEVGASIATFTRLGVDSAEAVTALRGIMNTLVAPAEQSREVLAGLGLTMKELRDQVKSKGLAKTLVDLMVKFKDNQEALSRLVPNVRALGGVLGTAGVQAEEYVRIAGSIEDANTLVDDGFKRVSETAGHKFTQALVDLQNVGIQLGDILLPVVLKVVRVIKDLVQRFVALSKETKIAWVTIAGLGAALGPALFILGSAIPILAAMISPIGFVVMAIAGLAASYVFLSENWAAVKERISDWSWWRNMLIDMLQFFIEHSPFALVMKGYNEMLGLLGKEQFEIPFFDDMIQVLEELKGETKEYEHQFGNFMDSIKAKMSGVLGFFSGLGKGIGLGSGSSGGGGESGPSAPVPDDVFDPEPLKKAFEFTYDGEEFNKEMDGFQATIDVSGEKLQTLGETASVVFGAMGNLVGSLSSLVQSQMQKELELAGNNEKKKEAILVKYAKKQKKAALFGAIVNGAAAIVQSLNNVWPVNLIAAVITGAAVAVQIGAIQGAAMAHGGVIPSGFPNDTFPAMLTTGETVIPPNRLGDLAGGNLSVRFSMRELIIEMDRERKRFG